MISMREAYEKIGANYDDACARLMGEEMLARFALKFLDDESMDKLEAAPWRQATPKVPLWQRTRSRA